MGKEAKLTRTSARVVTIIGAWPDVRLGSFVYHAKGAQVPSMETSRLREDRRRNAFRAAGLFGRGQPYWDAFAAAAGVRLMIGTSND